MSSLRLRQSLLTLAQANILTFTQVARVLTDQSIGCLCDAEVLPQLSSLGLQGRVGITLQLVLALQEARPSVAIEFAASIREWMCRFSVA